MALYSKFAYFSAFADAECSFLFTRRPHQQYGAPLRYVAFLIRGRLSFLLGEVRAQRRDAVRQTSCLS